MLLLVCLALLCIDCRLWNVTAGCRRVCAQYFELQGLATGACPPGRNIADFALQAIGARSLDRKANPDDPNLPNPSALFLKVSPPVISASQHI